MREKPVPRRWITCSLKAGSDVAGVMERVRPTIKIATCTSKVIQVHILSLGINMSMDAEI